MESDNGTLLEGLAVFWCFSIMIAFSVFLVICRWKIFRKAGKEGWESIIPVYNLIILLEIVRKPTWWIFLFLIPFYNIYLAIVLNIRLARFFGKDVSFGVLLTFFNFIFEPVLALGDSRYNPSALSDDRQSKSWP